MRATLNRIPKAMLAVLGPLTAFALLLSVQGCGTTTADATTTTAGPTLTSALKVFNAYVTANKVAVANHDQLLAESLTSSAQVSIVQAQYAMASSTGTEVTTPSYGKPTLYVPKLTTYPQWFIAVAPERPAHGAARTAAMVFDRTEPSSSWTLNGIVHLAPGAPPLNVKLDGNGYATPLATTDKDLLFRPDEVGAIQAALVDDGPSSPAAKVVESGPLTTGYYWTNAAYAKKLRPQHWVYAWQMEGTSFPFFALRTTDGGAIVFYTMSLNGQTMPVSTPPAHPKNPLPAIPVPDQYKPLLLPGQDPFTIEFDAGSTLQYLAVDPPVAKKGSASGKLRIAASGGGLTYAGGT